MRAVLEVIFQEATPWELRLGKIASVVFAGLFAFLFVANLDNFDRYALWLMVFKYFCYTTCFIFYLSIVLSGFFLKDSARDARLYPYALLISILLLNLALLADFHVRHPPITFIVDSEYFTTLGRRFLTLFIPVPVLIVFALLHLRIWAAALFFTFAITPLLVRAGWIINHPDTFFARGAELINANAINLSGMTSSLIIGVVSTVGALGLLLFNDYALKSAQKTERANALLGRYFAPDVRDEIEQSEIDLVEQEPRDLEVAIMFTDIVGFTKLSEKMEPKDVMRLLSDYQSIMVSAIFDNNGTVDKFIGDAVMANFGTPKSYGNDAQNAFNCAVDMNEKLARWNEGRRSAGLPEIQHRIGIHFGPCVVGNIGGEQRVEFAIIGDAVNVASRICDACKQFDTNFLISSTLAERVQTDTRLEIVKDFEVRGRSEKLDLMKVY